MNNHPLRRSAVSLLALAVSFPAVAEVYRCERDGRPVFTDQPCAGQSPLALPPPTVVAPEDEEAARAFDARIRQGRERRDAADARWLEQHEEQKATAERIRRARVGGYVTAGMTPAEVRQVLGEPERVRGGEGGERWTYAGNGGSTSTVVFREGVVADVQERRRKRR